VNIAINDILLKQDSLATLHSQNVSVYLQPLLRNEPWKLQSSAK